MLPNVLRKLVKSLAKMVYASLSPLTAIQLSVCVPALVVLCAFVCVCMSLCVFVRLYVCVRLHVCVCL